MRQLCFPSEKRAAQRRQTNWTARKRPANPSHPLEQSPMSEKAIRQKSKKGERQTSIVSLQFGATDVAELVRLAQLRSSCFIISANITAIDTQWRCSVKAEVIRPRCCHRRRIVRRAALVRPKTTVLMIWLLISIRTSNICNRTICSNDREKQPTQTHNNRPYIPECAPLQNRYHSCHF